MLRILAILVVILCSLAVFQLKVGFQKVDPSHDDWLLIRTTDRAPDYLTWRYFSKMQVDDLPDTMNYAYPQKISPIYTNILPLISYPLKWMGWGEDPVFQFYGAWFLFCFIMQGIMAYIFLNVLHVRGETVKILGAGFIMIAAPLLMRLDHPTLVHHWTVMAGLIPFFTQWSYLKNLSWYIVLAAISATTHPYMLPFGLGLPFFFFLQTSVRKSHIDFPSLSILAACLSIVVLLLWGMGAFGYDMTTATGGGFGYYSANLNTFYNNLGLARAPLDFDTYHAGAYEGFAYLGLGLLCMIAVLLYLKRPYRAYIDRAFSKRWIMLSICILSFTFFAFSDVWTFHEMILVSWPEWGMEKWFGIFRSSGRYIWLAYYMIIGLAIYGWSQLNWKRSRLVIAFLAMLLIQIWDLKPMITDSFPDEADEERILEQDWRSVMSAFDLIIPYPSYERTLYYTDDVSHLIYAASFDTLAIAAGHLPRPDIPARIRFQNEVSEFLEGNDSLAHEDSFRQALFITTDAYLPLFREQTEKGLLKLRKKGDYLLFFRPPLSRERRAILEAHTEELNINDLLHINEWLKEKEEGYLVFVGEDEVTEHAGTLFENWMSERGSEFKELNFRDAYFSIMKGDSILYEQKDDSLVHSDMQLDSLYWVLHSEGNRAGNASYIQVNDGKFETLDRGLNVFYYHPAADSLLYANFDTYRSSVLKVEKKIALPELEN